MQRSKNKLRNHIKELRQREQITQTEFAMLTKTTQGYVSKIERCEANPCIHFMSQLYKNFPEETVQLLKEGLATKFYKGKELHWFGGDIWIK